MRTLRLAWRGALAVSLSALATSTALGAPAPDKTEHAEHAQPAQHSAHPSKHGASSKSHGHTAQHHEHAQPAKHAPPTTHAEHDEASAAVGPVGIGPGRGAGRRRVGAEHENATSKKKAPPKHEASETRSKPTKKRVTKRFHHGRPPRHPSATLPPGAAEPQPDAAARHQIAGGPTDDDVRAGIQDPQLSALREADKVLFPRPLEGAKPGWSWDLPEPVDSGGAAVVASGLPPGARVTTPAPPKISAADAALLHGLTMPDLPVPLDARVVKYLKFYRDTPRGQAIARVWAKKSGRYAPAIKAELAKAGLPTDLVWLSLIESGHDPTIVSPAGAAGLWQFVPEAARLYGLTVDRWVDERLDPERSTEAAVRYLSDLHRRFGNWELAMAAYNMGYGGLERAIRKFNTNDFWGLSRYEAGIPWETTLYVPKILATAIVMNNKKAFGLDGVTPDPADRFDTVLVEPGVSLDKVASAAGVAPSTLADLNPDYLAGRTPPVRPGERGRVWAVHVPVGSGKAARRRLVRSSGVNPELVPYVVRFGDTVETIAAARGTPPAELEHLDHIGRHEELSAGTVILVPRHFPAADAVDPSAKPVVVVPPRDFDYPKRRRIFYHVLAGDTLARVARAFSVTRSELETWNALDPSARLQSGMVLQMFVPRDAGLDHVRHIDGDRARLLVAGSREFFNYFEAQKGRRRILVTVKRGDTLYSIGKRYGMSVGWMERVNRFSRHKQLQIGETVVVYSKRSAKAGESLDSDAESEVHAAPLSPVKPPRPDALPPVDASAKRPATDAGATG
jgi:peptidoglycan lytic transglycosylase D